MEAFKEAGLKRDIFFWLDKIKVIGEANLNHFDSCSIEDKMKFFETEEWYCWEVVKCRVAELDGKERELPDPKNVKVT